MKKEVNIKIEANFGSNFQEIFARNCLTSILKAWQSHLENSHKKNEIRIEINGDNIRNLDWFNFGKSTNKNSP